MKSDFSIVLKELRTTNKFTQQEVAQKLNISQRAYGFYETGDREPSLDTLINMADLFKVSLDFLTGRYSNKSKATNNKLFST